MITTENLLSIANRVVNEPAGIGDPALQANSESWAPYLRFMHALVKEYHPQVVVECGVYMGTCTAHMALGDPDTLVIGIDRQFHPGAVGNTIDHKNIMLIDGDTVAAAETVGWLIPRKKIGLLFLDSTHDGKTPRKEFEAYQPYFADECIVAVDDLFGPNHLKVLMQEFWAWLPGDKIELHFLHPTPSRDVDYPGFGVSIVRR